MIAESSLVWRCAAVGFCFPMLVVFGCGPGKSTENGIVSSEHRSPLEVSRRSIEASDAAAEMRFSWETSADYAIRLRLHSEKVSFRFEDVPLVEALRSVADKTGIPMVIDNEVRRTNAQHGGVLLRLSNAPIDRALELILDGFNASYIIQDGAVYVAPCELLSRILFSQEYELDNLCENDRARDAVQEFMGDALWTWTSGGCGPTQTRDVVIRFDGDRLILRSSYWGHRLAVEMIEGFTSARADAGN